MDRNNDRFQKKRYFHDDGNNKQDDDTFAQNKVFNNNFQRSFGGDGFRPAFGEEEIDLFQQNKQSQLNENNFKRQKRDDNSHQNDFFSKEDLDAQKQSVENAKKLPIVAHKKEILMKLEQNRVVIISGDTGCGKTTQVPKFILENATEKNVDFNIICTQPRRIAAQNIAKRVAIELGDQIGGLVGYQVGMEARTSSRTKILFMTTGIFLMRLVNSPNSLDKYTHIIMDEVHERDLDIDFSLVVIKHLLGRIMNDSKESNLKFKLILMSATFQTDLFANYFSNNSIRNIEKQTYYDGVQQRYEQEEIKQRQKMEKEWGPAKESDWNVKSFKDRNQKMANIYMNKEDEWVEDRIDQRMVSPVQKQKDPVEIIEINARPFKVKDFYIDEIINIIKKDEKRQLSPRDKDLLNEAIEFMHSNKPSIKEGVMRVASIIICDFIERQNFYNDDLSKDKKGILVFLPGYHEIFQFIEFIKDHYTEQFLKNNIELIPLHSSLSQEEQDLAFRNTKFMNKKRKVIVATNIAESSITIPDIKYIIDFMLTKDVYYDPLTKSESLQLHHSSQASSKQRAGRAGRVEDGYVFRMCSKSFFRNGIPQFPKPEMQRCPLEKLILQVKLWNTYEPDQILGRAIQPPELRDITNATKNLQETGALTYKPPLCKDEKWTPKITALGKIFVNLPCDLKITRLFLFGMALKCMHQAIIMGCIHSQTRSIFRSNRNTDQINLTKLQCSYDKNRDSDSIMLLQVYTEWQKRYHPQLTNQSCEDNKSREEREQSNFRQNNRRLRLRKPTGDEEKWCNDRMLDLKILRETAHMVEEIKTRFMRMNIPEKCVNSRVRLDEDQLDSIIILKTCIGGAFYNKYIKAAYKNEDMINKMRANKEIFQNDDHHRSLILNKVSEYITDDHLKQFFSQKFKVDVAKVQMSVDKPIIIFDQQILETGFIKACFKLGTRNRNSRYKKIENEENERNQKFQSRIVNDNRKLNKNVYFSYDEIKEKLECEELRRPNFLYELRFESINGENFVDFEMDSINNFTYELNPLNLKQVTFACQSYYDKGGRFLCRSGTRLPNVPMVDAIFCLIFAPIVKISADEKKRYFTKIICDNGETIIQLTHVLTHYDLELIQKIRTMFNQTLCNEDNIKQAHMMNIDREIKSLLGFNRLPLDIYQKLQYLRDEVQSKDNLQYLKKLKDDKTGIEEDNFFLEEELEAKDGDRYEEMDIKEDGNYDDFEKCADYNEQVEKQNLRTDKEVNLGYFLQPIFAQKLTKKIFFYGDLVSEMKNEFRSRLYQKREIIKKMKHKKKEYSIKDVIILCDRCKEEVQLLKTLKYERDDLHHAKSAFGYLRRVEIDAVIKNKDGYYTDEANQGFIECHMEVFEKFKQEDEENSKQSVIQSKQKSQSLNYQNDQSKVNLPSEKYAFCECRNHHLVGIVNDNKFYFTDVSELQLMFPLGHYEEWCQKWWMNNYKEAFELQNRYNIKKAEQSVNNLYKKQNQINNNDASEKVSCELCNKIFADCNEFIVHCEKDFNHKALIDQFTDETYDQIFEELDKQEIAQKLKTVPQNDNRFTKI